MGQSVRQQARSKAREAAAARRREREEAEKRRLVLAEEAAVALAERDDAVERHERAAGGLLRRLTRDEGVAVAEVADWVPDLAQAEVKRLLRLADDADPVEVVAEATPVPVGGDVVV